jgi:hypothetical protein
MYHAAVAFTHDIVKPLRQVKLSAKQVLLFAKNGTRLIGVGSNLFSFPGLPTSPENDKYDLILIWRFS